MGAVVLTAAVCVPVAVGIVVALWLDHRAAQARDLAAIEVADWGPDAVTAVAAAFGTCTVSAAEAVRRLRACNATFPSAADLLADLERRRD